MPIIFGENISKLYHCCQVLRKRRFQRQHEVVSAASVSGDPGVAVAEKKAPVYTTPNPKVVVIMARIHAADSPASFIIQVKPLVAFLNWRPTKSRYVRIIEHK
jgi:hypothetical protein